MKIGIASDHGGFLLKEAVKRSFSKIEFDDVGAYSEESCDYPDYISKACAKIQNGELEYAIVICGTGIGASMAANKMSGIRAALCCNEFMAEMAKRHNNANVLALGARVLGEELAFNIIDRWLNTSFEGGRHQRRIDKIHRLEGGRT
ncbi:MAG: ribose 5-phosphate isomerase B [Spirochaetes bacterium]|nr:ribose 5-phosphate isomerase B [Spirochaetota bacterium]